MSAVPTDVFNGLRELRQYVERFSTDPFAPEIYHIGALLKRYGDYLTKEQKMRCFKLVIKKNSMWTQPGFLPVVVWFSHQLGRSIQPKLFRIEYYVKRFKSGNAQYKSELNTFLWDLARYKNKD